MKAGLPVTIDDPVYSYLSKLDYSAPEIARMSMNTRLFHDLGFYGDTAEDLMWVLDRKYGVDLSGGRLDRYFPPEFEGTNKWTAFVGNLAVPIQSRLTRDRDRYPPLTLGMINMWLLERRWSD